MLNEKQYYELRDGLHSLKNLVSMTHNINEPYNERIWEKLCDMNMKITEIEKRLKECRDDTK